MDFLVNAVKAYFNRSWTRKDMMSLAPIPQKDCTSLNRMKRVSLLMISSFFFGASVVPFTKYFFTTGQMCSNQHWRFLVSSREDTGKEHNLPQMPDPCFFSNVATMLTLFIGYLVLYSQEILYDARFGHINAVNRTLTIFFHLPAVVIHAARLCMHVKTQRADGV
ncbi:hypothetical protein EJD97_000488 [Solanum chilense]|uniref:Uncharacterized protein n=1 Tax=Solanum chilense TaxID=4083 RepID=A0A6N2ANL9_SOLCI|nr:hypothetical protein EJD97_000488 [Solanum chilense]